MTSIPLLMMMIIIIMLLLLMEVIMGDLQRLLHRPLFTLC